MNRPSLIETATAGLGGQSPPRLSIDMNRFTLVDGSGNEKIINSLTLDVVFVGLNPKVSKIYYDTPYAGKEHAVIPACFSDNGVAPSTQADTPQATTCAVCPRNVIGSAISKFSGAKIKECVDFKKLAFIIPGDPNKLIYLMTIKPGSFKNWTSYVNWIKTQSFSGGQKPDLYDLVTRLSFESQGVLKFEPASLSSVNTALVAQMEAAWSSGAIPGIVGQNDAPYAGQVGAPAATPAIAAPATPAHEPAGFALPEMPTFGQPVGQMQQAPLNTKPAPTKRRPRAKAPDAPRAAVPVQFTEQDPPPADSTLEIPPFLQRGASAKTELPAPSFGMAPAEEPSGDMGAVLDAVFKLPT